MITVVTPLAPIHIEQQHATKWHVFRADYPIRLMIDGVLHTLIIPAGFRYDKSSIPDAAEILTLHWITKDKLGCHAPGGHDGLTRCKGCPFVEPPLVHSDGRQQQANPMPWCVPHRRFTRAEADGIFYQMMLLDEVTPSRALWAWRAVRWFAKRW